MTGETSDQTADDVGEFGAGTLVGGSDGADGDIEGAPSSRSCVEIEPGATLRGCGFSRK